MLGPNCKQHHGWNPEVAAVRPAVACPNPFSHPLPPAPVQELAPLLHTLGGLGEGEPVDVYEEVKFEPAVMVDRLSPTSTLAACQLEDGDILVFQRQLSQVNSTGLCCCAFRAHLPEPFDTLPACLPAGGGAMHPPLLPPDSPPLSASRQRRSRCSTPLPRSTWSMCATGRWAFALLPFVLWWL